MIDVFAFYSKLLRQKQTMRPERQHEERLLGRTQEKVPETGVPEQGWRARDWKSTQKRRARLVGVNKFLFDFYSYPNDNSQEP